MIYKLLLVKNRYTKTLNFKKGLEWFKINTPLDVIIADEISTDFEVTTEKISNATYSGVICGDDIYPKLRTVIEEGKYNAVVFVYGNNLNGIRVNATKALPLYPGTDLVQICTTSDGGKSLNHEIFHTFFHRLQRQQVMIEDPMDSVVINGVVKHYYNNESINAKPSNRSIAIERLTPYWDKVEKILILNQTPMTLPTTSPYTHFSTKEIAKFQLKTELWEILDDSRALAGTPFILTSGFRTVEQNAAVGGKANSSHLRGLAADISCVDNKKRTAIIRGILGCGRPVFLEIAKKHIHIDIDSSIHELGQTITENDD